jgi:hypothetical protein
MLVSHRSASTRAGIVGTALDCQAPGTTPGNGLALVSQRVPSSNLLAVSVSWPPARPGGACVSRSRRRAPYISPRTDKTLTVISSANAAAGAWSVLVSRWTYRAATWASKQSSRPLRPGWRTSLNSEGSVPNQGRSGGPNLSQPRALAYRSPTRAARRTSVVRPLVPTAPRVQQPPKAGWDRC